MPISKLRKSRPWPGMLLLGFALVATACNSYCQSGPKHGTQCYSQNDVEQHQKQQQR